MLRSGGEIGEEVRSMRKETRETKGIPSSSENREFFFVSLLENQLISLVFSKISPNFRYHKFIN